MVAKQRFEYEVRDVSGRRKKGTILADNQEDAIGRLRAQGQAVLNLQAIKAASNQSFWAKLNEPPRKASQADLAMFTRQLATMLGAGIPLLEAVEILAEQVTDSNKGFGRGLEELGDMVRGGIAVSEGMAKFRGIFPEIYVNMIKAGEASGQLDTILDRLADYMESSESLKREIKSAMTYPVISLLMILGITAYLLVGVVPKFEAMFDSLKADLPPVTVVVLFMSEWLQANIGKVIGGIVIAAVAYTLAKRHATIAYIVDTIKLRMPVFGALSQKVSVSRFARTFSTLLSSGVPILGALEIVANTSGNKVIESAVMETRETVRAGETLTSHLATCWVFPPMVVRMIAIGEKSGALEQLLSKIADFYDEQVHATVKGLTSLIEPIMIGVMGVIVGTIVLAIFWPILELQKQLGAG